MSDPIGKKPDMGPSTPRTFDRHAKAQHPSTSSQSQSAPEHKDHDEAATLPRPRSTHELSEISPERLLLPSTSRSGRSIAASNPSDELALSMAKLEPVAHLKKKSHLVGVFGSLLSAAKTLKEPHVDPQEASTQHIAQMRKEVRPASDEAGGLAEVKSFGTFTIEEKFLSIIESPSSHQGGPSGRTSGEPTKPQAPIHALNIETMQKLAERNLLAKFVSQNSVPAQVYVYVKTNDGTIIDKKPFTSGRQKLEASDASGHSSSIRKNHTDKVSIAAVMALECLCNNNFELFGKIASIPPYQALMDICTLPLSGSIFSRESILALLQGFSPSSGPSVHLDPAIRLKSSMMGLALRHYFKNQSAQSELTTQLSLAVKIKRKSKGNEDLLLQNTASFLSEVSVLTSKVLMIDDIHTAQARTPDSILPFEDIQKIAWQAAHVIGEAFVYATQAIGDIKNDEKELERNINQVFNVITTAAGAAGSLGVPSPVVDTSSLIINQLGGKLAEWLVSSKDPPNFNRLAENLAYLSNAITKRSQHGFLVPGEKELIESQFNALNNRERENRLRSGKMFSQTFRDCLSEFKDHTLQNHITNAAQGLL